MGGAYAAGVHDHLRIISAGGLPPHPSPLAQADCEATEGRWTLVFTRDLRHPTEKVWAALTEPGQLAAWAPYTADRDLSETGGATITMIDDENPQDMAAEVVRAEPPALLE